MKLDLTGSYPNLLKQTPEVRGLLRLAIEEFTAEILFIDAFPSETEHLKNHRQILVNIATESEYVEMAKAIVNTTRVLFALCVVGLMNQIRRN